MRPSVTARMNPSFPRNWTTPLTSWSKEGILDGSEIGTPSEMLKCIPMQIPASCPFFAADSADLPFTYKDSILCSNITIRLVPVKIPRRKQSRMISSRYGEYLLSTQSRVRLPIVIGCHDKLHFNCVEKGKVSQEINVGINCSARRKGVTLKKWGFWWPPKTDLYLGCITIIQYFQWMLFRSITILNSKSWTAIGTK